MRTGPVVLEEGALRTALISPDPSFRALITGRLAESAAPVEWVLSADDDVRELGLENVERLLERDPNLLFIDIGASPAPGAQFISALTSRAPEITVVAAGASLATDDLLQVVRAGAREYIRRPFNPDEVADACSRVFHRMRPTAARMPEGTGRIVALFSPKGGTGVSTMATNLAVHIQGATRGKTLLVDLSPELGTCSVLLGVQPRYSYLDVVESLHRMDERLLHSFLEEHESGVRILASPAAVFTAQELTSDSVTHLFRLLRRHFDHIVVDVGRGTMDQATVTTLGEADEKLLVTTADLPTLRNVKRVLPRVPGSDNPTEKRVRLVLNRYEEGRSVGKDDVERAVGLPLFCVLDEDRDHLLRSVNLGRPIVLNGASRYSAGVKGLADRVVAADMPEKSGKRGFAGMLRTMVPSFGRGNGHQNGKRDRRTSKTSAIPQTAGEGKS